MTTPPKAKAYQRGKDLFFYLSLVLNVLVLIIFTVSGLSLNLADWAARCSSSTPLVNAIYFSVFYFGLFFLFLPLRFYQEHTWEHRFNLSNQNPVQWFIDHLKQTALGFLLAIICVEVVYSLLGRFADTWWIWTSVFWLFLALVLARIMPNVIIPLFYKYSSVPDQNLRTRILDIFKQCEVKIKDVYMINFSKKTKKANAFICGLGQSRRIVLSDTLIEHYTVSEIEAVVAHEIAHYKHKDIWQMIVVNSAVTVVSFFLMNQFLKYALVRLDLTRIDDIAFFPVLVLGMSLFNLLTMPFLNSFSRWMEVRADQFCLDLTKNPASFISLMNKLGEQNLSESEPHWLKEFLFYDHPSIGKRIQLAAKSAG